MYQIETGRRLGTDDLTLKRLHGPMGFAAVFVGIGNPEPKTIPVFDGLSQSHGYYTSKDFLPRVSRASKPGMCACRSRLPVMGGGAVVVLGAGDTAFDCATSALRSAGGLIPPYR